MDEFEESETFLGMGGESLGTYSIEVDSASSRPCVVCAMCVGAVSISHWPPESSGRVLLKTSLPATVGGGMQKKETSRTTFLGRSVDR